MPRPAGRRGHAALFAAMRAGDPGLRESSARGGGTPAVRGCETTRSPLRHRLLGPDPRVRRSHHPGRSSERSAPGGGLLRAPRSWSPSDSAAAPRVAHGGRSRAGPLRVACRVEVAGSRRRPPPGDKAREGGMSRGGRSFDRSARPRRGETRSRPVPRPSREGPGEAGGARRRRGGFDRVPGSATGAPRHTGEQGR
jgi:hypothetical protein